MGFNKWFETLLKEKGLDGYTLYEIEHEGQKHFIPNEIVYEEIKKLSLKEKEKVKSILVKIDFYNKSMTHFFEHLAKGYVEMNYKAVGA